MRRAVHDEAVFDDFCYDWKGCPCDSRKGSRCSNIDRRRSLDCGRSSKRAARWRSLDCGELSQTTEDCFKRSNLRQYSLGRGILSQWRRIVSGEAVFQIWKQLQAQRFSSGMAFSSLQEVIKTIGYFQRRVLNGARYAFLNSFICLTNASFAGIGVTRMIQDRKHVLNHSPSLSLL